MFSGRRWKYRLGESWKFFSNLHWLFSSYANLDMHSPQCLNDIKLYRPILKIFCGGYYCFTVLTADFNSPFAGSYASVLSTGSSSVSYNYWNSAETLDPFPAKNRGLYFNSNQFLGGSINLSNTWSMGMWVYAISGTIISHSTNKLTIMSSGTINFDLETWDGTSASYSASKTITSNTWRYVSYSVFFANKATTLTPYLNNVAGVAVTVTDYVFRLIDGETLYIGKGSPNFNGFISYFQLWQTTKTDFSVPYNLYGFSGGAVSTLWPCDYSHYYDGSTCQPCLSSGSCTMGCTRGTSCYICDDFLCSQCSSFLPNACTLCISNASGTPCICNPGFYQPTNQALCSPCSSKCASCSGSLYTSCTSCNSGYFLYNSKICVINCPTGYIENSSTKDCSFSSNIGLSLTFYDQIKLGSVSGVQVGPSSNAYPTYEAGDPYPQYLQGYYFKPSSYMLTDTVIGPYFTISVWIYSISLGPIVTKIVSGSQILCLEINGASPQLSLILSDSSPLSVLSSQNILINAWSFVAFTGKIDASSTFTVNSYFNSMTTESETSSVQAYFQDQAAAGFYIGKAVTSGFEGFLYNINIFNEENFQFNDYTVSSCASPCTECPSDHNCPKTCQFLEFYNGSSCEGCSTSCTDGCRYSISTGTCTLCKTKQCYQCDSFSGSCSSCIINAESDGSGGCKCEVDKFWNSGSCEVCDVQCSLCKQDAYFECITCAAGTQLVSGICLNECPYGYGLGCAVVSNAVIDQLFDIDFQSSYGIFTTGAHLTSYQHFWSPEADDPIPAYKRGLYFDGSMYLESSVPVFLSHSFSIGLWCWDISDGDIVRKNNLQISSGGSIRAEVFDNFQGSLVKSLTQSSLLSAWNYVSIVVAYTSSATVFEIYVNGNLISSLNNPNLVFKDQASTQLQIGKVSSSTFAGFLYNFQLWSVRITDFLSILDGFIFCGAGQRASCLPTCLISEYQNGATCSACSSCSKGCVRSNSCNICYDTLCLICAGFELGQCTQCITNANLVSGSCTCNPAYGISNDGLSCVACPSECSSCSIARYNKCSTCVSGFFLFASTGQCLSECPSGYNKNSVTRRCEYLSNLGINLDLTDQICLDTVSGFYVGSNNANIYPDWSDTNDPIPAYKRGYYFNSNDFLAANVIISPSFTISIWTKPLASGILVTKYTSSDIFKITVDLSGHPALSIIFSDLATSSLTTSTSILNSWHFLSFTGEVQSDGKTTLTLYINAASISSITTTTLTYFKDAIPGTLYIGNNETSGSSGLQGFLARLMIYNTYNHQADDYTISSCGAGCSVCPSNHQCLSECDFDKYPDSCTACSSCSNGCVNNLSCNLCRDKECYSCITFSGECTNCITNAYKSAGHCTCLANALWVSSSSSCELCNSVCSSCSTLKFNGCLACISGYLVQSLCISFCPTGCIISGSNCNSNPAYTNCLVFNLKPHQIKDVVTDSASNIPVLTGTDNKFYPTYDSTDPIPAIYRGYYFTGSSYMQLLPYSGTSSPLLTFTPKFTISAWIKPITNTGVIFSKQANSGLLKKFISLELINKAPSLILTLKDSSTITYTSSNPILEATLSQWNFISVTSTISSTPQQTISLSMNGNIDSSIDLCPSWLNDLENSFTITIGAYYTAPSSLASFFNGFLWDLKVYNTLIAASSLTSSSCSGCSLCPVDNANKCLDSCLIDSYWNGSSCTSCSTGCLSIGCVRSDNSCNLCSDVVCEICDDYTSTCITCKTHASLIATSCQCNSGYYWSISNESCDLCHISCKTCTSPSDLDCLTCADGYYKSLGICVTSCPPGYSPSSSECVLAKEKVFDLDLNTLSGVIYDKASSIPVITGSTEQFYPEYEADDPIPAYLRGFWFNGQSSLLRLPEYSSYTSPRLVIGSTFTFSIWLNIENSSAALLSKHDISNNYSTLYSILLTGGKPMISLMINSSLFFYTCQTALNDYEWSHLEFTLETSNGYNIVYGYINGVADSSGMTGYGSFSDIGPHTTVVIGSQISSQELYNFYQGFIYSIQIFNVIKPVSSLSAVSCTESCSVCLTSQICIPNCKINEYWHGPAYNLCHSCNTKCEKSCRDWRDTCSLCDNLLCKVCINYSAEGCVACKENSINTGSCICDDIHVLDTSNNNTCISIMPGGYRGPDGIFYACPNLCTICESFTKCTACVENASLKSDLCYCDLGYRNETTYCSLVTFSAKLTVFSDNSLCLSFSESLAEPLTVYDFMIIIEKQGEISCKIEQINSTCYYISLNIKENISKGTLATLAFLDLKEIRSVSNGILNSTDFIVTLNSYDPDPYSPAVAAVASQATAIAQTTVAAALAISFINPSPSSLWSIINTLQILSYLTLSGIPFSNKLRTFLNNLSSFSLLPNIFNYIIDQNEGNSPYFQAQEFGFETDLILINQGSDVTLILASIAALPLVFYFSRCSHRWVGNKLRKTLKSYQFAFYLRFWIQCYLELGAAASIGIIDLKFKNATQITNFIICLVVCITLIITPGCFFWFSYRHKSQILSSEKKFFTLFGSFFYEFKTDRNLLTTQYYLVFFVRRLIYVINLVYLRNYPTTEVTINIVLSIMTILQLLIYWPFKDNILQISNLVSEILICLIMGATGAYLFSLESNVMSKIEDSIVVIVIVIIGIQLLASIAVSARAIYEFVNYKLNNRKNDDAKILPMHNQIIKKEKKVKKIIK